MGSIGMRRRTFLLGLGVGLGSTAFVVACGSDDDTTSSGGEATDESSSTTAPPVEGSTPADAELIAAAVGDWEAISSYTDTGYAVAIAGDGTFTMRGLDPERPADESPPATGTWVLDDGTLTIEVVVPGDPDGEFSVDEVLRCVLEGAALDTALMEMVRYTVDGSDQLDADGIDVEVEWQGSQVLLDGSWQCAPAGAAPDTSEADLVGTWEVAGEPDRFCSVGESEGLELTLASFTDISFDDDGTFVGQLWCAGLPTGPGINGSMSPEIAAGRFEVRDGAVLLSEVTADGDPLSEADAEFVAEHPTEVEVVDDVLYVREPEGSERIAYERAR